MPMKRKLSLIFALVVWFAIITQYFLFMEIRIVSALDLSIRFLSYFTIQTNLLIAFILSCHALNQHETSDKPFNRAGILTALTVFITVVGAVYQIMLRPIWDPKGMFRLADELLHSFIPLMFIAYWYKFEDHARVNYFQIGNWLLFPLGYLIYILILGFYSGFYPYPFVNVHTIGIEEVLLNSLILLIIFILLSAFYIFIGKRKLK